MTQPMTASNCEEFITEDEAKDLIANGVPMPVGYRLLIKPIEATIGLEKAEKEKYQHLARAGFETKTDDQQKRESRGTFHGILIAVGGFAYGDNLGGAPWVEVGDVVIFDRYAGVEMELPPGSGDMYRFCNDESILGKMMEAK